MVEWNIRSHFRETIYIKNRMMSDVVDELIRLLERVRDHYGLSRYLEPHLSLVKSQVLYRLYDDLRYSKGMYRDYIPLLVNESIRDYRLSALIVAIRQRMEKEQSSLNS